MRNRIETNDDKGGASIFREVPRGLSKDNYTSVCGVDDVLRMPTIKHTGGFEAKPVPERTRKPLPMVFITRASSQEMGSRACGRLAAALSTRGHHLLILEQKEKSRKKIEPPALGQTLFYDSVTELKDQFASG